MTRHPNITISKETTYITEPLRADGYVDYVAAINRHCSEGVTVENNAAVLFCEALGPKCVDQAIRAQYFEALRVPELPKDGDYLVSLWDFLPQHDKSVPSADNANADPCLMQIIETLSNRVERSPWTSDEFPKVAALLEKNARPLQLIVEGSQRPRFFSPTVLRESTSLAWCDLAPMVIHLREGSKQLRIRAMLHLGEGRLSDAWNDAMACHRLARLVGEGPLVVHALIAVAYHGIADTCTMALAQHGNFSAKQAKQWLSELRSMSTRRPMRDYWAFGDRLFDLAHVTDVALNGYPDPPEYEPDVPLTPEEIEHLRETLGSSKKHTRIRRLFSDDPRIDWNEVLRCCNEHYDQLNRAVDCTERTQRYEAIAQLGRTRQHCYDEAMESISADETALSKLTPETIARYFDALFTYPWFGGTHGQTLDCEYRTNVSASFAALTLALAGYHHDHRAYPKSLAELCPQYIPELPQDPFGDGPFQYRLEGNGYLLYSVGPNGKDDDGRNFMQDDERWYENESATEEQQSWDDIAIRTPPK